MIGPTQTLLGGRPWHPFRPSIGDIGTPSQLGKHLSVTLAKVARFGAQYPGNAYTVAQHCCSLSVAVALAGGDAIAQAWAMVHEAYEGFTGFDVTGPMKPAFPRYVEAEDDFLELVAKVVHLPYPMPAIVGDLDARLGAAEGRVLIPDCDWSWQWPIEPLVSVPFLDPPARPDVAAPTFDGRWERDDAEVAFLARWQTLVLARLP